LQIEVVHFIFQRFLRQILGIFASESLPSFMNHFLLQFLFLSFAQNSIFSQNTTQPALTTDSIKQEKLTEIVVSASRVNESLLRSPISIEQLKSKETQLLGPPNFFDALQYLKEVQVITPSLGFKVLNTRGFANTTNVRFAQLVDGVDNQAPHIGAPIANAMGVTDLDIQKIELVSGAASALYGMNAVNGLANFITKNPFYTEGVSFRQVIGVNHVSSPEETSPHLFSESQFRIAKVLSPRWAFKLNTAFTKGYDWVADDKTDIAATLNASAGLVGTDNPALDPVNGYGNESSNRKTLAFNGKNYVVGRTGYQERDVVNYNLQNLKGDFGLYFRPKQNVEIVYTYRGALLNNVYQRSNRFQLTDYILQQHSVHFQSPKYQFKTYLTTENTGKSYNLRSAAENIDKAFKTDDAWFKDYTTAFKNAVTANASVAEAHHLARASADLGRFQPNTAAFKAKLTELSDINNWDIGAALRVKALLSHTEGVVYLDKFLKKNVDNNFTLQAGFDYRAYIIVPDGNYFINPVESGKNLIYGKLGGFIQSSKSLINNRLKLNFAIRADKSDYFDAKFNPRLSAVYSPNERLNWRISYQSGYRFPSIFEGFSNINSGGVKRIGGLRVMSNGIFENSWLRSSIDAFQTAVNKDVNTNGLTQKAAIEKNKDALQRNSYTYLQPEYIQSYEIGIKHLYLKNKLFVDANLYYNKYNNFMAQVEAYIPKTGNADSFPISLITRALHDRYRLWTNSQTTVFNYGASIGIRYNWTPQYSLVTNATYAKLDRKETNDGLEDGFNTPSWTFNGTLLGEKIWKNLNGSVSVHWQKDFVYQSFLVNGTVPSYTTIDAQTGYDFSEITLKLGATNLLNTYYYSMLGGVHVGGFYYMSVIYKL
jgi:outer membrane receptor protein involved in Fe transport